MLDERRREIELDRENQRLAGGHLWPRDVSSSPALPAPRASLPSAGPIVEVAYQDRELQREALRGVIEYSRHPAGEAQAAWIEWMQHIRSTWPSFAAEEVIQKAEALRDLLL